MKFYHGEVKTDPVYDSDKKAEEIAAKVAEDIQKLGGTITVGRNFGDAPAILIVMMPDTEDLNPSEIVPGVEFKPVAVTQVPAVEDHGIEH